jgi:hypothetical protein
MIAFFLAAQDRSVFCCTKNASRQIAQARSVLAAQDRSVFSWTKNASRQRTAAFSINMFCSVELCKDTFLNFEDQTVLAVN